MQYKSKVFKQLFALSVSAEFERYYADIEEKGTYCLEYSFAEQTAELLEFLVKEIIKEKKIERLYPLLHQPKTDLYASAWYTDTDHDHDDDKRYYITDRETYQTYYITESELV